MRLSVGFVVGFYAFLTILAWGLAKIFGDINLLIWHDRYATTPVFDAGLGAAIGLVTVLASQLLDRWSDWAKTLGQEFGRLLGELKAWQALVFALASAIGEEILFRGLIQQALTIFVFNGPWADGLGLTAASIAFGLLHMGPDLKTFWPWTLFAIILGFVFGAMYLYTGNLLAPIVAHFTINFINLQVISQKYGHLQAENE